jgi:uncharacterized protein (DUF305 family)
MKGTTHMRLATPLLTVAAATTLFAACGSDEDATETTVAATEPAPAETAAASSTTFNDADVQFAQGMIAHHEQAIEMAEIALDPAMSARPEVVDLANRIQAAQDPEIQQMTAWLTEWGQPVTMDTSEGHDMSSMEGMMTAEEMDALAASTGPAFDTMWLEMMIRHHQGAVAQAQEEKLNGSDPEALALADQIIAAQQAEISEMEQLLAG